jgi:hypothetical protein
MGLFDSTESPSRSMQTAHTSSRFGRTISPVFSVKLVARPDPRMVEVPLEIEAELPREFDGAALLASSGLPRKVKLKAPKDGLKLSTAYRADQLLADIVRSVFRGAEADVARVQESVTRFVRTVRERRQEGAMLTITTNGRGKVEVAETMPPLRGAAPMITPVENAKAQPASPALDRRINDLETAVAKLGVTGELAERLAQLEERVTQLSAQLVHLTALTQLAGPGMEQKPAQTIQREGTPRRATAVEAYAEGLRAELQARSDASIARCRRESERADKAAALSAESALFGAANDGTAERLRADSAQAAAKLSALQRLASETDLYAPHDLPIATQLFSRLDAAATPQDVAIALEPVAQAVVRAARGEDEFERTAWLARTAALCGWELVTPVIGRDLDPEWHQSIDGDTTTLAGGMVVSVACPGLRRADGSGIVRARVSVAAPALEAAQVPLDLGLPPLPATAPPPVETSTAAPAVDAAQTSLALREPEEDDVRETELDDRHDAGDTLETPPLVIPAHASSNAIPLPAPTSSSIDPTLHQSPFGDLTGGAEIKPEEAAAAAAHSSSLKPKIVNEDGARGDLGLAAEVNKSGPDDTAEMSPAEQVDDDDVEEVEELSDPLPEEKS